MRHLVMGLTSLCWTISSAASIVPDTGVFQVGETADEQSIRVSKDGVGGAALAWRTGNSDFTVQRFDDSAAPLGQALVIANAMEVELDGHHGNVAIAWHDFGPCGLVVLDETGSTVFEREFNRFACEISDQPVSWIDEQRVAFAYGFVDESVRPWQNVAVIAVANIVTGEVTEFRPVALDSTALPAIDADDSRILVSQHDATFEIGPLVNQLFDLDGQPLSPAFQLPAATYYHSGDSIGFPRLRGDHAVILSSRCEGDRCGRPTLQSYQFDTGAVDGVEVVPAALINATPSLHFVPRSLDQGADGSLLARWNMSKDAGSLDKIGANIILDADGQPELDAHIFQAITDRHLHHELGIELESATGAVVAEQRALVAWVRNGTLNAQYLFNEVDDQAGDFQASLDLVSCDENLGWARLTFSSQDSRILVRSDHQSGELIAAIPAGQTRHELLVELGSRLFFMDTDRGAVLAEVSVPASSSGCADNRLTVTPTSSVDQFGRFSADISWEAHSSAIEVRLGSPDGRLFAAGGGRPGEQSTGNWVRDGMRFFLITVSADGEREVSSFKIARP